jgi:hypothetical protein
MEWIVAAALILVGIVAAVGIYLGERDPVTRAYKPGIGGPLGRTAWRSPHEEGRETTREDGGPPADKP